MAGTGPPPKDADERRRRNAPARGEWTFLPMGVPKPPVLPALKKRSAGEGGAYSASAKAAWKLWREDPATLIFGPGEIAYALDTISRYDDLLESKPNELRLRMDGLGLTPKGKRDLRLRITDDELSKKREEAAASAAAMPAPQTRRRMRAVDSARR